jgi:trehalose 6-phosphate phosphatase
MVPSIRCRATTRRWCARSTRCASAWPCRPPDAAAALVQPLLRQAHEPTRVFGSRRVANVMAADAPDKADAMLHLVRGSGASCAIYIGDDETDEPVFRRAPPHWLTVRVGRDDPHSAAAWYLDAQSEVGMVLEVILTSLTERNE